MVVASHVVILPLMVIVCTGFDDATLRIWDPKSGEIIHVVGAFVRKFWRFLSSQGHPYHTEGITSMAISPDSTCALTGSKDGSVCIVNITTERVVNWILTQIQLNVLVLLQAKDQDNDGC